jgi:glycosyltransferase involved in cell wall biosynthesis
MATTIHRYREQHLMNIGIANEETWGFFQDIYDDLSKHHNVRVFERHTTNWPFFRERRDRYLFHQDLSQLLTENDVVFFEWASELLIAATQLPKTCKIVTRLHRYEMYRWVDLVDWDKVDKIILVSKAKQREFIKKFPSQASKTVVINVAVALDKFTYQPHPYSGEIGTLCHLTPRKRVYELILDLYELLQRGKSQAEGKSSFHLHIGGGAHHSHGDYDKAMHDLVTTLGLQDHVTFYGNIEDTWNWYHKIDIFISNSYSEGMQVAPMEAMASGCYCLSHHWTGADEMLPAENLYFSSSELQDKILEFDALSKAEQEEKKVAMRDLARKQFNLSENIRQVRELIEALVTN